MMPKWPGHEKCRVTFYKGPRAIALQAPKWSLATMKAASTTWTHRPWKDLLVPFLVSPCLLSFFPSISNCGHHFLLHSPKWRSIQHNDHFHNQYQFFTHLILQQWHGRRPLLNSQAGAAGSSALRLLGSSVLFSLGLTIYLLPLRSGHWWMR